VTRVNGSTASNVTDVVAVEAPLEIRIGWGPADGRDHRTVAVTMRTPGCDKELAIGFLLSERIIKKISDVVSIFESPDGSRLRVDLVPEINVDWRSLERHFFVSSACGVCGKVDPQQPLAGMQPASTTTMRFRPESLSDLPDQLRHAQGVFDATGGLHACGLFDANGRLVMAREDVGRHNALDKLIGAARLSGLATDDKILLVSGRASYELVEKTVVAGIPLLAAIGAPSSMAVSTAEQADLTLVGFLRKDRFNVYTSHWRLCPEPDVASQERRRES
jgi:FdhD protein